MRSRRFLLLLASVFAVLCSGLQYAMAVIPTPIFLVPEGKLSGPTLVAIGPELPNGCTRITTDGSTPGINSRPYFGPINVSYTQTLKAAIFVSGVSGPVVSATYELDASNWPPPPSGPAAPSYSLELPTNAVQQP
jgi:hypothetical protein